MLALIGSGEYLPPIEALDRRLIERLPKPVSVVCLPTAAGTEGPNRIEYWEKLGEEHFCRLGVAVKSLPIVTAADAADPKYVEAIRRANFVYLSGGHPDYLYQTLQGSPAWSAILAVLEKGGLLAGCSAGAMVMGEAFFGFSPRRRIEGFRLLPGAMVIPHYDEIPRWISLLIRFWIGRGLTTVGIEANTALVVDGGRMEALGSGGVTVWNGVGGKIYRNSEIPSWLPG